MVNFENYIELCNQKFKDEYSPKLFDELHISIKKLTKDYNGNVPTSIFISELFGLNANFANRIALEQIKNYNDWLLKNYNITPKE